MSHPSNFGGKALNVVLFALKDVLRNEKREGTVLNSYLLDARIEPTLDLLPDGERGGLSHKLVLRITICDAGSEEGKKVGRDRP